jgi:hypothetical protein
MKGSHPLRNNLIGERFGRLVVKRSCGKDRKRNVLWFCRCDCGGFVRAPAYNLRKGTTQSCGCLQRELVAARLTTHGNSKIGKLTGEYQSWSNAKQRCTNPKREVWHRYGGRGITMCDHWLNSFASFLADMGKKPSPRHTLERRDNNKGYEPGNCLWALLRVQCRNRSTNVWVEHDGRRMIMADWAQEIGLSPVRFRYYLKRGLSVAEIIATVPLEPKKVGHAAY